jgi:hypothetical protein
MLFVIASCHNDSHKNALDEQLNSGQPFFTMLYTQEFSKRFSLPPEKAIELSEHIQAIAVEFNKNNFKYTCDLHFYVDDDLDIYTPTKGQYFFDGVWSEFFFIKDINENDYAQRVADILNNNMKMKFLSSINAEYNFTETLSYSRIHKSFIPGITLLSIETGCYLFEKERYPADIWIQKQDVGDYLLGNDGPAEVQHKENNYRFPIPIQLIEQIQPYIELAVDQNEKQGR